MIAIPLDDKDSTKLSKLYGNAPYFALLNEKDKSIGVVENKELGKGPKSAEYLKTLGVSSTVYYHMGEGVYKSFVKNGMDVFTAEHNEYTFDEIFKLKSLNSLTKLDDSNFDDLLDPGDNGACKCGCND